MQFKTPLGFTEDLSISISMLPQRVYYPAIKIESIRAFALFLTVRN